VISKLIVLDVSDLTVELKASILDNRETSFVIGTLREWLYECARGAEAR